MSSTHQAGFSTSVAISCALLFATSNATLPKKIGAGIERATSYALMAHNAQSNVEELLTRLELDGATLNEREKFGAGIKRATSYASMAHNPQSNVEELLTRLELDGATLNEREPTESNAHHHHHLVDERQSTENQARLGVDEEEIHANRNAKWRRAPEDHKPILPYNPLHKNARGINLATIIDDVKIEEANRNAKWRRAPDSHLPNKRLRYNTHGINFAGIIDGTVDEFIESAVNNDDASHEDVLYGLDPLASSLDGNNESLTKTNRPHGTAGKNVDNLE